MTAANQLIQLVTSFMWNANDLKYSSRRAHSWVLQHDIKRLHIIYCHAKLLNNECSLNIPMIFLDRAAVPDVRELRLKPSKTDRHFTSSLSVLLLDVACDVHEEGKWQQQGLHNVGNVEVSTSINLGPLCVIVVEPWTGAQYCRRQRHMNQLKPESVNRSTQSDIA